MGTIPSVTTGAVTVTNYVAVVETSPSSTPVASSSVQEAVHLLVHLVALAVSALAGLHFAQ